MFTIQARFGPDREAQLAQVASLDAAIQAVERVLGIDGHTVQINASDRKRMRKVGETLTVASPRPGSMTKYVIANMG